MTETPVPHWDKREAKGMIRKWIAKGAWPGELVWIIDDEAREHSLPENEQLCRLYWDAEDVQGLFDVTAEEAVSFLLDAEDELVADLTDRGYAKLEELGKSRGLKARKQ